MICSNCDRSPVDDDDAARWMLFLPSTTLRSIMGSIAFAPPENLGLHLSRFGDLDMACSPDCADAFIRGWRGEREDTE